MPTKDRRQKAKDFRYAIYFFSLWSVVYGLWSAPAIAGERFQDASGYARAIDQVQSGGKPMIVYFYTDWCPYCRKFEKNVLADASVEKKLESFVFVQINPDKGSLEEKIAQEYRVDGYPTVVFTGASGSRGGEDAGRATRSPAEFVQFADRYLKKHPPSPKKAAADPSALVQPQAPLIPDHVLYLKNGRKVEGQLVSEEAKGVTLAMDDLGEVYFSKIEYDKLEEIKK